MFKIIIFSTLLVTVLGLQIHGDYTEHHATYHHEEAVPAAIEEDTEVHHDVQHKHAESHQSFKIHHFHAVPVYVKKEDQQFLKNPVELGKSKQKLKLIHPETEHHHGYGAVLENHQENYHHSHGGYEHHHHD